MDGLDFRTKAINLYIKYINLIMRQVDRKKLSREEKKEIRRKAAKVMGDKLKYRESIKSKTPDEDNEFIEEEEK